MGARSLNLVPCPPLSLILCPVQEYFNCTQRGDRWFLAAEPSVECYDFSTWNQHRQLLPLCITAMIVYVIGIPVLFASLLFGRAQVRLGLPLLQLLRCCHCPRPLAPAA